METNLIKQEFIIKSLKPYFQDRNNCGYNETLSKCEYKTKDGKKCVVGQYFNTNRFDKDNHPFFEIVQKHTEHNPYSDFNDLLLDEAKYKLTENEWYELQAIHDILAKYGYANRNNLSRLTSLEKSSNVDLTELKQMLTKHSNGN